MATLHVLSHTFKPHGGVVKTFDYAAHARAHGLEVVVWSPEALAADAPLLQISRMADLLTADEVLVHRTTKAVPGPSALTADDLVLISLPPSYDTAVSWLAPGQSPARVLHLVQNTRHTNAEWLSGRATRLLTRPASRVSVTHEVAEAIAPWLDPRAYHRTVVLGHDLDVFRHAPDLAPDRPRPETIRVATTTWKSDIGDRVAVSLADDPRFSFAAIREPVGYDALVELYQGADVFLAAPQAEEGFYMPGLEAMAAGDVVITPDVGGNRAYCDFEDNCLLADLDDVATYRAALLRLAEASQEEWTRLRSAATATTGRFELAREAAEVAEVYDEVLAHAVADEARHRRGGRR